MVKTLLKQIGEYKKDAFSRRYLLFWKSSWGYYPFDDDNNHGFGLKGQSFKMCA